MIQILKATNHFFAQAYTLDSSLLRVFAASSGSSTIRYRLVSSAILVYTILVGWGRSFLSVAWPTGVKLMFFFSFL